MKTILVTGNNGYIGPVMTRVLKAESYRVVGLDSNWFEGREFFEIDAESRPHGQIVKDVRDITGGDLDGIDGVIHLAGLSNDPMGAIDAVLTEDINYAASMKLAKLCREKGVGRFIFASSCSIYGISDPGKAIDEGGTLNPITAYAKAKVNVETGLTAMADDTFHPVFMRNATVYGLSPRLRLDLVVNDLLAGAYLTGGINIKSDGTPWRPIVHIEDFCRAFVAALKAPVERIHCEAFNVGINEENFQVGDIATEVGKALPDAVVKILNETGGDDRSYRVDFSKIRRALPEFKPSWNLKKGIRELLDAYRKHNLTKADYDSGRYVRLRTLKSHMESGRFNKSLRTTGR
jgi:nucleoside-diphosphate-sugar epimerase